MKNVLTFVLLLGLTLLLAACGGGAAAPTSAPEGAQAPDSAVAPPADDAAALAVEAYLTAKVAGDREGVAANICAALESRIDAETLSFNAVQAALEEMSCASDAGGATVTCTGRITAVYGGENRDFPLATYAVTQEDGEYKWCGEPTAS
ncbi:MAG: hypothetical protein KME04_08450 [Pleurocapsa minor GSE-CHR-MK-17-07R]|jgi:hypothetical protein|nr:hypothetical protein [Pleurocapsa minor GSE-CHR-MK 17-07R]